MEATIALGPDAKRSRIVVIGGGFAGLSVLREPRKVDADVVLVDRHNHFLFQPLVFQVATAMLSPAHAGTQGGSLLKHLGAMTTKRGTVTVGADLTLAGDPTCFVVGDAADYLGPRGRPLPGLATVAKQQGQHVGRTLAARAGRGRAPGAFAHKDAGSLATTTRRAGVAEIGSLRFVGLPAWLLWGLVHLATLAGGHSRLTVFGEWIWGLVTDRRSARLIVQPDEPRPGTRVPLSVH